MKKQVFVDWATYLLIILFLYTAISKMTDLEAFRVVLLKSPITSYFANWIQFLVPISEIIVVALLVMPKLRRVGLYLSFILMLLFTGYVIAILGFSKELPCQCGGVLQQMSWKTHLIFNIFFVILSLGAVLLDGKKNRKLDRGVRQGAFLNV